MTKTELTQTVQGASIIETELIQAIQDNSVIDYIYNNYWRMDKETLRSIIVQLLFTLYDNGIKANKIDVQELAERIDLDTYLTF